MAGLVEERNSWRKQFEDGEADPIFYLESYREGRNSESYRQGREFERLCEYTLWLEEKLYQRERLKALQEKLESMDKEWHSRIR